MGILDPDVMRQITDISVKTASNLHSYYSQPDLDRMNPNTDSQP